MNDKDLLDRRVLVTGGAGGIGQACARHFLGRGAQVTLVDIDGERLDAARERLGGERVTVVRSALGDARACAQAAAAAGGPLHALVHMAGVFEHDPLDPEDRSVWDRAIASNLSNAYEMVVKGHDIIRKPFAPRATSAACRAWCCAARAPSSAARPTARRTRRPREASWAWCALSRATWRRAPA